jgi:hypothetical protein
MANPEHLDLLKRGTEVWNQWRQEHPNIQPDLSRADLKGLNLAHAFLNEANLMGADLREADLKEAVLFQAFLKEADLSKADLKDAYLMVANLTKASLNKANLSQAYLSGANLRETDLRETDLTGANLREADLRRANLGGADLRGADLRGANLVRTSLVGAVLTSCLIWGTSVWNVELEGAIQFNLVITHQDEPVITVDNLEVAQFIYLLLNNHKIRGVIDTITSKVVLILGRFTAERKAVLDALREELRKQNYLPALFDFEKPASRDLTGTVSTLAHLARFIIVDLTDPSSAPHEVVAVIPHTIVPVQPLILDGEKEYSMFRDLRQRYHWVLPTYSYTDQAHLLATLQEHVIAPAEQKAQELEKR